MSQHDASSPVHYPHGQDHPYHLVHPSAMPVLTALSVLTLVIGTLFFMHGKPGGGAIVLLGFALIIACLYFWWRDVVHEGRVDKAHTDAVRVGLRMGMGLFITSEVMFFVVFFWAFFNASTLPRVPLSDVWAIVQGVWPPAGVKVMDAWHYPFMNTLILLLSGTTVTWAHYELLQGNYKAVKQALWYTIILGLSFTCIQAYEYVHAAFHFKDGIYSSTFYMATGFHGFHVIVGTAFLSTCLARVYKGNLTTEGHLGFEFAAWYWHFVDVVWLFLFVCVYWWGGGQ